MIEVLLNLIAEYIGGNKRLGITLAILIILFFIGFSIYLKIQ